MLRILKYGVFILGCLFSSINLAAMDITVPLFTTVETGTGKAVGLVMVSETKYGLLFIPNLMRLQPGLHGFHVHENPDCSNNGMAAGGHFDPKQTGKHLGPYNDNGHLGDLPALFVADDGTATLPVLAPRLKSISMIKNRVLMVHEGGDNYADTPVKLGGGGPRMECGIIK